MADESRLNDLHAGIDTDEAEMARYRARLGDRLESEAVRRAPWRRLALAVPVLAAVVALLLYMPATQDLQQERLEDLEAFVSTTTNQDSLERTTRRALADGNDLARFNANMLVCLTRSDGSALREAAHGAITDPRPEFRAWYLEYLLDFADSYQLDPDRIEEMIDAESDPSCLDLWDRLLDLAETGAESMA